METEILEVEGVWIEVDYHYSPAEYNNHGHPDDREEDLDAEVDIVSVRTIAGREDIYPIISDEVVAIIETHLLDLNE